MASKSRALLLSLPPLARRLRQMGVSTVIAASLLLLAAEASAQAPLVTIQSRVVTNNSPNPYSTLVGTATYGATGAGPGYHIVVLSRTTLALVSNHTYGLDFTSIFQMNLDIFGLSSSSLVIISSMGPATSFSPQAASYLNGVAANLGGSGEGFIYGGGPVSPSAYSLIGVPGLGAAGGSANQVSTYADPDTNGNISGVLIPDVNSNYTFTYSRFVEVQTITPPGDTITIGPLTSPPTTPASFKAPPFAGDAGVGGGFHVLIVKRATLNHIATDPSVVILHSSYHTNASDASLAASETHRMASDLNRFPNGLQTGNLIFIISTLGCNSGFNPLVSVADFEAIQGVITQLGGAGLFGSNTTSIGYYSIIGIPNSGSATLSPEVRSWATPQLSGNITAVLQQNNVGVFTPVNVSAAAGVTLDLSLLPTALAPPSQWPVAPHGSDAVCPAGAQQCAAYKWISFQLICAAPACTNKDIRGTKYTDLTFSLSDALDSLRGLQYPSQPTVQPAGFSFSRKAFSHVQEQLETEIQFAMDVQSWFANVKDVFNDLAITGDLSLQAAIKTVQSDVQLPQSTTLPFNVTGVTRDAVMVATIVAGAVQPELVPAFAAMNAGLYLEMQFNNAPSGASGNQFVTEEVNLFNQLQTAFNSAIYGHGILEAIVLTDWIKLQTIGTKIENASKSSSPWFFGTTTEADLVNAATNAYTVSFYQGLMAAKYQMVNFSGVPFSDPSSYNYNTDCQISMGTKFCSCSGQIYSPPSGAWTNFGTTGPFSILMAVSPIDGSYPSNALTTKLFNTKHLYSADFFSTARGWSGIQNALPQGWSDYQNNGACLSSPAPAARRQAHGLPGAVLAHRPFRPSMALAANAKKPKPPPGSCSPRRF